MPCGCQSACGCNIVGDGVTTSVVRVGDEFMVSATQVVAGLADTDCISLTVDESGTLMATPIIDPADHSVILECTGDGLAAEVRVDEASTAIVSVSADGLRVDVPPADASDGTGQPGDYIFHAGVGSRSNAIDADGSAVSRAGYPALWDALSLYAEAASRNTLDPQINGISSTRFIEPGMVVEATGFPAGTVVLTVDSSTSITLDQPSTDSGSDTEVRVYPHGAGDGILTFNVPDMSRRYPLGWDYGGLTTELGETGGAENYTPTLANLPRHNHLAAVTDPGHDHGGSTGSGDAHSHEAGSGAASDFVTIEEPVTGADFVSIPTTAGLGGGATSASNVSIPTYPGPGGAGNIDYQQGNRDVTSVHAAHSHTIPPDGTGVTVAIGQTGSLAPTPIDTMSPYLVGRWMVHT